MEESDFAGVGGAKPFVEEASTLVDGTICSKTGTGEPLLLLHGIFVESRSMGEWQSCGSGRIGASAAVACLEITQGASITKSAKQIPADFIGSDSTSGGRN